MKWEVEWEEREGREVWAVTARVLYRQPLFTHGPTSASVGPWVGGKHGLGRGGSGGG